jgi:hypothetical protein
MIGGVGEMLITYHLVKGPNVKSPNERQIRAFAQLVAGGDKCINKATDKLSDFSVFGIKEYQDEAKDVAEAILKYHGVDKIPSKDVTLKGEEVGAESNQGDIVIRGVDTQDVFWSLKVGSSEAGKGKLGKNDLLEISAKLDPTKAIQAAVMSVYGVTQQQIDNADGGIMVVGSYLSGTKAGRALFGGKKARSPEWEALIFKGKSKSTKFLIVDGEDIGKTEGKKFIALRYSLANALAGPIGQHAVGLLISEIQQNQAIKEAMISKMEKNATMSKDITVLVGDPKTARAYLGGDKEAILTTKQLFKNLAAFMDDNYPYDKLKCYCKPGVATFYLIYEKSAKEKLMLFSCRFGRNNKSGSVYDMTIPCLPPKSGTGTHPKGYSECKVIESDGDVEISVV